VHYFLGTMMPSGLRIEFLISPITQSRDSWFPCFHGENPESLLLWVLIPFSFPGTTQLSSGRFPFLQICTDYEQNFANRQDQN
jgi:hypothetical protein